MSATSPISDEVLMAYADGALSEAEARAVEAHLAENAEARELVAAFRESAELAARAFDQPMTEPVSQRLIDTVRGNQSNVIRGPWTGRALLPLAAAMTLTAGLALGFWLSGASEGDDVARGLGVGPLDQTSHLAQHLETRPSGTAATLQQDRSVVVVGTFRDRSGRPCREFEVLGDTGNASSAPETAAIACRAATGSWTVEGVVRIATGPETPGTQGYVPSGAQEEDALQKLVEILGATSLLPADEEARLIENGWD